MSKRKSSASLERRKQAFIAEYEAVCARHKMRVAAGGYEGEVMTLHTLGKGRLSLAAHVAELASADVFEW